MEPLVPWFESLFSAQSIPVPGTMAWRSSAGSSPVLSCRGQRGLQGPGGGPLPPPTPACPRPAQGDSTQASARSPGGGPSQVARAENKHTAHFSQWSWGRGGFGCLEVGLLRHFRGPFLALLTHLQEHPQANMPRKSLLRSCFAGPPLRRYSTSEDMVGSRSRNASLKGTGSTDRAWGSWCLPPGARGGAGGGLRGGLGHAAVGGAFRVESGFQSQKMRLSAT